MDKEPDLNSAVDKMYYAKSMRAKAIIIVVMIFVIFFGLSSCAQQQDMSNTSHEVVTANASRINWAIASQNTLAGNISHKSIPMTIPEGWGAIDAAGNANGGIFYVSCKSVPMGQSASKTEIRQYDPNKGSADMIFSFDERNTNHWVNEFVASDTALFWVYKDGVDQRIERYDLRTSTVSTVKTVPVDSVILLTGSGNYVTWFEGKGDGITPDTLYALDVTANTISVVSEDASPSQLRAYVSGNITSYVSDSIKHQIVVYDLQNKKAISTISHETTALIDNPNANSNYLLWEERESVDSSAVKYLLYDRRENKLYDAALNSISENIFSTHLMNDSIIINTTGINGSSLLSADLENDAVTTILTADDFLSWCYVINGKSFLSIKGKDSIEWIYLSTDAH